MASSSKNGTIFPLSWLRFTTKRRTGEGVETDRRAQIPAVGRRGRTSAGATRADPSRTGKTSARTRVLSAAFDHFESARIAPASLGEPKHLLANQSDVWYWLGVACEAMGDRRAARNWWSKAAAFRGDFQEMSVRTFSEMTYYSALSLEKLGRKSAARELLRGLLAYAKKLFRMKAAIPYFATSLPALLLFEDDLQKRQGISARFLMAQACAGTLDENKTPCGY